MCVHVCLFWVGLSKYISDVCFYLSVCLSVCQPVGQSACLSGHLCVRPSGRLSGCLTAYNNAGVSAVCGSSLRQDRNEKMLLIQQILSVSNTHTHTTNHTHTERAMYFCSGKASAESILPVKQFGSGNYSFGHVIDLSSD